MSRFWLGRGMVRRLPATCAMAFALVVGGIALLSREAEAGERHAPLSYHAIVLNGAITGSGFQIADGIGVTNAHVVADAPPGSEVVLIVGGRGGLLRARAQVIAVSERMDLAVLKMPKGLLPVPPVHDAPADRGRVVRAAGVVARADGPGERQELAGRIASDVLTLRPFGPGLVAHMPGIRRGFSGGPVLDEKGRLVGMVAALRPDPGWTTNATGEPMAGREAFVLTAPAIRAEAARLLGGSTAR